MPFLLLFSQNGLFCQELDTLTAYQHYQDARKFGDAADYQNSILHYQKAKDLYEKAAHWKGYVKSLNGLGACHSLLSKHKEAQSHLQIALSVGFEKLGEQLEVADTYQNLGFDWSRQGDYEKQFDNYKKALTIRLNLLGENHPKVAQTYSNLAVSYKYRGDYENALRCAKIGLDIHQKTLESHDFGLSQDHTNIGAIYLNKGEYKKAQDHFQRALDVMENASGEQNQFLAIGYSNLGKAYDAQGRYGKAIEAYGTAVEVLTKLLGEKHVYAGIFYNNLGAAYLNNGDAAEALRYHKKALAIFSAVLQEYHPYIAATYINLGKCFAKNEEEAKAVEYFKKGLTIQGKVLGNTHPEVANTYHTIGSYHSGQKQWEIALSYFQNGMTAIAENFDKSDIYANPSPNGVPQKNILLDLLHGKTTTLWSRYHKSEKQNLSDLNGSLASCLTALEVIDQLKFKIVSNTSKRELIEKSIPMYKKAIEISFELFKVTGDTQFLEQAFGYSEKSKAFLLLQELRYSEIKKYAGIPDSIIQREKDLRIKETFYGGRLHDALQKEDSAKVKLYRERLLSARTASEETKKEIENRYTRYHKLKYDTTSFSLEDIQQKLLDHNDLLLEFFVGEHKVYLFSVSRDGLYTFTIEKTEVYKKFVQNFRKALTNYDAVLEGNPRSKRMFVEAANGLFEILLKKPLNEIKGPIKKIIVVTDGELSYLNFEAFLTALPQNIDSFRYKDLDYLIKDYQISYSYSSTLLGVSKELTSLGTRSAATAVFGGFAPDYDESFFQEDKRRGAAGATDSNLAVLTGAVKEVRTIAEKFDGTTRLVSSATEGTFKEIAHKYQILHLAMHGLLDDANPMFSKLLFNPTEEGQEDGSLNASEIYNLELNADLVVLSACDSGIGNINKGEGIMSLSQAFAYAGCPTLVSSLWKVPDESTVVPMVGFYDHLINGLPIDGALQRAKLDFLKTVDNPLYEHPFFWAGFIVHGNTAPLVIEESGPAWYIYPVIALFAGFLLLFLVRKGNTSSRLL